MNFCWFGIGDLVYYVDIVYVVIDDWIGGLYKCFVGVLFSIGGLLIEV